MKVFITGATGLVGAHTVMALLDAGHQVRLLVRDRKLATEFFSALNYVIDDIVVGDMLNQDLVKQAIERCDAVFHAAAMVSLDLKKSEEIYQNNIKGIDSVIGSAIALGIGNIVYVSSFSALFDENAASINEDSPLCQAKTAYMRSKCDCEAYVRQLQDKGHIIKTTYPSGVFAPFDPRLSESNGSLKALLAIMPITSSGLHFVDGRDLANVHLRLLENQSSESLRYIVGGHFYQWADLHTLLETVCQRKIPSFKVPGAVLRLAGSLVDSLAKFLPIQSPVSAEAMLICTKMPIADSSKVLQDLNMQFRQPEETLADTITWLVKADHINNKLAGKLA